VIACLIMTITDMYNGEYRFEPSHAMIQDDVFFWAFIVINSLAIAIPLSKLIWIFVEEEQPEDGMFRMKTEQGKFNLEMEMYADIAKMAVLAAGYVGFLTMPSIADPIAPKDKPVNPNKK